MWSSRSAADSRSSRLEHATYSVDRQKKLVKDETSELARKQKKKRTFSPTMDVHAREPIVSDKTPLGAVRDVPLLVVEVSLRKSKIDHVYHILSWLKANDTIPELYIPVQHASRVHKLQARNLPRASRIQKSLRQLPNTHKRSRRRGQRGGYGAPAEWR
jgi:hypothetical protein